jgi:hypothetical protein
MATTRPRAPRKYPPVAQQPAGDTTLNATFEPESSRQDDIPKATFVGEQLMYQDRSARIAEAAYFRAQQRGFAPGYELEDWLAAEKDIDATFGKAD